ncbi:MAG: (Fe-S)-binding protein [Aquificaceae bacterium]
MEKLVEIPADLIQKCVKCGLCKSVCPTYPTKEEEGSFARGRLTRAQMVLEEELPLNREITKEWDECAMCRRCEWICPNDVHYKEIMVNVKHIQKERLGMGFVKNAGLKSLEIMQSKVGRIAVKLIGSLANLVPAQEIKVPFPTGAVKFMPKPSAKAFDFRGRVFRSKEERGRLLFFTGCMIDAFYGKTGESVIKLLNNVGYTVVVPKDIKCCGAPHYYSGNKEAFERLREHNMKEIKKWEFDAVVVACPTCGGALQEDYGIDEVYDFAQILYKHLPKFKGSGESITFHVPCHSYSAMKVKDEVFYSLIESVENAKVKKAEMDRSCCGFAGLFSITNPTISDQIQKEKIQDLKKTRAEIVLTACPGCVLNLKDGSKKHKTGQKVMHLADYLAESLSS